jgi:hypothetical protein
VLNLHSNGLSGCHNCTLASGRQPQKRNASESTPNSLQSRETFTQGTRMHQAHRHCSLARHCFIGSRGSLPTGQDMCRNSVGAAYASQQAAQQRNRSLQALGTSVTPRAMHKALPHTA